MRYLVVFDPDEVRYAQFQGTAVGMFYSSKICLEFR